MELETDDPVKSKLLKKSAQYREDLEDEAKVISERTERIIKNALIVGGSLALAYLLYNQLSGSKKKKSKIKKTAAAKAAATEVDMDDEEESSLPNKVFSQIGTALVSQAGVLLLSLAKEKLMEYLNAQAEKKKNEHPE
jgi:FtsZ-interacting cell division protein ZipA